MVTIYIMKKTLITIIIFLISIEILISQTRFEQGYSATFSGLQKDRKDGIFKHYDFVWKQTRNLFVVKKIIHEKDGLHTLRSWLINEKGEKITKKAYTDIGDFSEGLAEVTVGPKDFCRSCFATGRYNFVVHLNNNCGFIDQRGNEIIPTKYYNIKGGFSSGFCLVAFSTSNYFYIDKKGQQQYSRVFRDGEPFRGNVAGVTHRNGAKNFINTKGENLIPKYYDYIQPYSEGYEGMIRAYQPKGGKIGFWTSNCEELIQPQFDDFNYGYLRKKILVKKDNKYGFLDFFSGQSAIPIKFEAVKKDKNLDYTLLKEGNDWFRSDTSFNLIRLVKAEDIESLGKGIFKFSINNKWGIVDSTGKTKCNPIYSEISNSFVNDYLPFKSGSKFGYLNSNGKLIINPEYDKVGAFQDGLVNCDKGIYQYSINSKGVIVEKNVIPNLLRKAFFGVIITLIIGMTFFVFRVK